MTSSGRNSQSASIYRINLSLPETPKAPKSLAILLGAHKVAGMLALISTLFCWVACRLRSHAEPELFALRHQVEFCIANSASG
jgi:hypothetical protein